MDLTAPRDVTVTIAAFPSHYAGNLKVWLYYRHSVPAGTAVDYGEWGLHPYWKRILLANDTPDKLAVRFIDGVTIKNLTPWVYTKDPNTFFDDQVAQPGGPELWILPGLGHTTYSNSGPQVLFFANIRQLTLESLEVTNAVTDGIAIGIGPNTSLVNEQITVHSVLSHDNDRVGFTVTGAVDTIDLEDSCFLDNGIAFSIDDELETDPNSLFQVSNIKFSRCVFGGSSVGVGLAAGGKFGPSYRGIIGITLDHCTFYRNINHVTAVAYLGGSVSNVRITCCHFIESLGVALSISTWSPDSLIEKCTFVNNWRRFFVQEDPQAPLVIDPTLDAPFYFATQGYLPASEILFSGQPWAVHDCLISLGRRGRDPDKVWRPNSDSFNPASIRLADLYQVIDQNNTIDISQIAFDPGDPGMPGHPPIGAAMLVFAEASDMSPGFSNKGLNPFFFPVQGCSEPSYRKPPGMQKADMVLEARTYSPPAFTPDNPKQQVYFDKFKNLLAGPDCSDEPFT